MLRGWLKLLVNSKSKRPISLLLFAESKRSCPFNFPEELLKIHDFFTVNDSSLTSQEDSNNLKNLLNNCSITQDTIVVIDCLSSLILNTNLPVALKFLKNLRKVCHQVICVNRNFAASKTPHIENFGTNYVELESSRSSIDKETVNFTANSRVFKPRCVSTTESVSVNLVTFDVKSVLQKDDKIANNIVKQPLKTVEASFKIETSAQETEQKKNTPLPYMLNNNSSSNESKIYFEPDEDEDEEDPDDDLDF